ncbi:class I SAM-dependent methyltransferase [Gandjariella thermophila]|uniref:Methyltransferase n=1 Tax=Gandjariella thermophila TaxID=1931992 RepID=A0A4D4JHQ6_9PSEU|nr:class I SAM-dependent methyltransferase [Gandjariella thermophila]GDY33433.1 methyltransferase [Gandjariella thermophila]
MSTVGRALQQAGFGCPHGLLGRIGGWLMARGNAATERHMVELAELHESDAVLVVGPGPGVGLRTAGERSARVVGIDPSDLMLATCRRRCADLVRQGRVRLRPGTAEQTGQPDQSVDVVLSVNNVFLWPDWHAGFTELHRVLRPGGRLLLSTHLKWLPGGLAALAAAVEAAGFADVHTWTWRPPGPGATTAAQLRGARVG